jgi:hypothetical protein
LGFPSLGGVEGFLVKTRVSFLRQKVPFTYLTAILSLKGLSHEIDFKNVDENGQILALLRAAAGFGIFRRLL